jgi:hypothetical protein
MDTFTWKATAHVQRSGPSALGAAKSATIGTIVTGVSLDYSCCSKIVSKPVLMGTAKIWPPGNVRFAKWTCVKFAPQVLQKYVRPAKKLTFSKTTNVSKNARKAFNFMASPAWKAALMAFLHRERRVWAVQKIVKFVQAYLFAKYVPINLQCLMENALQLLRLLIPGNTC